MNTQRLEFNTQVPNGERGRSQTSYWDAWGTSGDNVHFIIGANIVSAYHDFYERALQTYWVSGESSHILYDYDDIGGDAYSNVVLYASNTLECESPDLVSFGANYNGVYESIVASTVGNFGETFSIYPTRELATLESLYDLRDRPQVMTFVACNLSLVPLLQQIPEQVKKHFGGLARLSLEVVVDQEEKNDKELVAFICTGLSPDEAFARLRAFDRDWWLGALVDARGKLLVHVEFK